MRLLYIFLILPPVLTYGQEVEITQIKRLPDNIEVYYNIIDEKPEHSYSMQLYSSLDNFVQPLEHVDGDVGIDIKVGENKKIIWNAREELGPDFDGRLTLELKGNLYVAFISVEGLEEGITLKRGVPHDFKWSGGRGDNVLNFELYQGENLVSVFEERPNIGNTSLTIPTSVKPGKDYHFLISDTQNRDEAVYTSSFNIKRKIPLGLKVGLGLVIGSAVAYLVSSGTPVEEQKIDVPPSPPGR